jgi:NitT/TauT family transport system substrate-binding protein
MALQINKGRITSILLVLAIGLGLWFAYSNGYIGQGDGNVVAGDDQTEQTQPIAAISEDGSKVVRVGVVTWPGYLAAQYWNNGFMPNSGSRYRTNYGFDVQFILLEDQLASRSALISGDIDLLWSTVESFSAEAAGLSKSGVEYVWQSDFSRGGDACVVRADKGINSAQDLRGKTVAYSEKTPSHAFLMYVLEAGGLTLDDITPIPCPSALDAAQIFNSQQADVAIVWAPDNINCVETINARTKNPNAAKVLMDTKTATHIIADGFLVKKSYKEENFEMLVNLFEGWAMGAAELQTSEDARQAGAQILVDNLEGFATFEDAYASLGDVYYTTIGDNVNFFGLNRGYSNVTAQELYEETGKRFIKSGVIASFPNWAQVSDRSIVQEVAKRMQSKGLLDKKGYVAENTKVNTAPSPTLANTDIVEAVSSKALQVYFKTGSSELDFNAKNYIKAEFGTVARTNMGATIRIVGNTDAQGSKATNERLSKQRAESVKQYMVQAWSIDPNRVVAVGNGPKKAFSDGAPGANAAYRTVDFELVTQ